MNSRTTAKSGFTLIELMIVVGILGMLAAILVPAVAGFRDGANQQATTAGMADIRTKLDLFDQQEGKYPQKLDDLVSTKNKTSNRPFLGESPTDGWGEKYYYSSKDGGTDYELRSHGKDKIKGGNGHASDIVATSSTKPKVENP